MPRSSDKGIAIIFALFMTLALSVLGMSLMFMSETETWGSANYRLTGQARYAAESGVHRAANYLLSNAYVNTKPSTATGTLALYDTTQSPVKLAGTTTDVVLSSDPDVTAHYADAAVTTAFSDAFQGNTLALTTAQAGYTASARLLSMQEFTNAYSGLPETLQTWQITGVGNVAGPRPSKIEVSVVLEQELVPVYRYAAFATDNGCEALKFGGGATTTSYDSSSANLAASEQTSSGNVGTNGNLTELGATTAINGSLSTPRTGVGNCTAGNVTAETLTGGATVTGGLTQLSQSVTYPTPTMSATPPTVATSFGNGGSSTTCPAGVAGATCNRSGSVWTITPLTASTVVTMGNVTVSAGYTLTLNAGTYAINSIKENGNGALAVGAGGAIRMQVAGVGVGTPIDLTGGAVTNATLKPELLQITYAGGGIVKLAGNSATSALVYAPNATAQFVGGSQFYGAVITKKGTDMGGMHIHYDRQLLRLMQTASSPMMSSFNWKSF